MPCYRPWRLPGGDGQVLPCGQCRGCRARSAREWSMRCMHEASLHEENCFVTLTYDDAHLPKDGSLDAPDPRREYCGAFGNFMKRLRKEISPRKVRYYHVGEYGEVNGRPHYHALLFGWSPSDKKLFTVRKGFSVFTSDLLRATWGDGLHEVGSVTQQSASYVARYLKKRITGSWAKAKYGKRAPEYGTMSRNPGIGAGWIDKYRCEVYPVDSVVVRGTFQKPPRYYDDRVGEVAPELLDGVKLCRYSSRRKENEGRLAVMEAVAAAGEAIHSRGGSL